MKTTKPNQIMFGLLHMWIKWHHWVYWRLEWSI